MGGPGSGRQPRNKPVDLEVTDEHPVLKNSKKLDPEPTNAEEVKASLEGIPNVQNGKVNGTIPPPKEEAKKPHKKKQPKKVKLNLTQGSPIANRIAVLGALPVFAGNIGISLATKGKVVPLKYVAEEEIEACGEAFKPVLGELDIEITPVVGWLLTCGAVLAGGVLAYGVERAIELEEKAGIRGRNGIDSHAVGATQEGAGSPAVEAVPGQPQGGAVPSA